MAKRRRERAAAPKTPWSLRAAGLLLLAQSGGLGALAWLNFPGAEIWQAFPTTALAARVRELLPLSAYSLTALVALLAAFGLWGRRANAWHFAMLAQGITLGASLTLYFNSRPGYIYILMAFAIYMVLYLHNEEIQLIFHTRPAPAGDDE
jgi:hypothetical protein